MFSTLFCRPAARNPKRAQRRPTARYHRRLRLEPLETRRLLTTLLLSGYPASTTAGVSHSFVLGAFDTNGALMSGKNGTTAFTDTVLFSSTDSKASYLTSYAFTAANGGIHTFSATFKTPGTETLTAKDELTGISQSFTVTVYPFFAVTGLPASIEAGTLQTMTVTALDANGNPVTNYTGTVHFTSSDPNALLPAN